MSSAASGPPAPPPESSESTERIYHPDLGWSPAIPRCPSDEQFIDAMTRWSNRIVIEATESAVIVKLDDRVIHALLSVKKYSVEVSPAVAEEFSLGI